METAITTAAFFCLLVFFVVLAIAAALKAHEMERERNNNINNQNTDKTMNDKKKKYIANAFSLQMLASPHTFIIVDEISEADFKALTADAVSAVGHPDTAAVLGVACNRMNVTLSHGDTLYVAQLTGGRLPEGATTLPDGFGFRFRLVSLRPAVRSAVGIL